MATIEQNLTSIAASLQVMVQILQNQKHEPTASPAAPVVPAPAPAAPVAPPVVAAPVVAPVSPPAPVAAIVPPAPPPAPAAPTGAPTTIGDLQKYVMQTYTELGPEKGASIQGIITACGVSNINEINAAHFGYIFEQVERLKVA